MPQVIEVPGMGQVEFPDGMTDDEIVEAIKRNQPQAVPQATGLYDAPDLGSATLNLAGAALEPIGVLASGAAAVPIAGLAGIGASIAKRFGLTEADAADIVRTVQETLTYKPGTEAGRIATEYGVPGALGKVGELASRAGGALGARLESPAIETAGEATAQALLALAGAKGGGALKPSQRTPSVLETQAREGISGFVQKHVDPHLPGGQQRAASRIFRDVVGEKAPEVAAALERPPPNPLNIPQTAGIVAADVGSAEMAALQAGLAKHRPSEYYATNQAAEAARRAAIQKIGKTPEELQRATKERDEAAARNYEAAGAELVKQDTELNVILNRPSGRKAVERAKQIAEERGEAFEIGDSYPVRSLHYVKMAMDDMLKTPEQFGIGGAELGSINATKKQLVSWLGKKSPKYEEARSEFAKASIPINQMEIGQALENKLVSAIGSERAGQFATATRESAGLIKKSTGHPRYTELSQVLNPQQMEIVNALVENLKREAKFEGQAQAGGFAAQEKLSAALPYIPPPGMFSPALTVTRNYINRFSAGTSDKVLHLLAELMRDPSPKNVSTLLRKTTPQERAVINEVRRLGNRAFVGAAVAGGTSQNQRQ